MLITLTSTAKPKDVQARLQGLGLWASPNHGLNGRVVFQIQSGSARVDPDRLLQIEGVAEVLSARSAHPRVDAQEGVTLIDGPVLMAGPCAVESRAQVHAAARAVAAAGGRWLRGGAFKPRTSPYSFTGHGLPALSWMLEAARQYGLKVVSEVMSEMAVDEAAKSVDLIQIGARNMQNFSLLAAVGQVGKPVLLKRGLCATVDEWLGAGEHLLAAGAAGVIFCERGVRGPDSGTRFVLDLGAVAHLKHALGQPVIVDPSHAAGRNDLVLPLARAAMAAGADGLLVEEHPDPGAALSDGPQALLPSQLAELGQWMGLPSHQHSMELLR